MDYSECFCQFCEQPARLQCFCEMYPANFCHDHIAKHFMIAQTANHSVKIIINDKESQKVTATLKILKDSINKLNAVSKDISNLIMKHIQYHTYILHRISSEIELFEKSFKEIKLASSHQILTQDYRIWIVSDAITGVVEKAFLDIQGIVLKMKEDIEQVDRIMDFSSKTQNLKETTNYLYFCKKNTKALVEFDPDTLTVYEHYLNVDEILGGSSAICSLPNGQVFSSGGWLEESLSLTFLYDFHKKTIEFFPKSQARSCASALFHDESVYIFGGLQDKAIRNADKFSIKTKSWSRLADLVCPVRDTSTLLITGQILISGDSNFLSIYKILNNVYYQSSALLSISRYNILIKDEDKVVLLTNYYVYEADVGNLSQWKRISKLSSFSSNTTSKPVIRGRFAYFSDWVGRIAQFNLDSYDLKIVTTVESK